MLVIDLPGSARRGRGRTRASLARLGSALVALCGMLLTEAAIANPPEGVSHRAAREEAARAIPFQQLSPAVRGKTWEIVSQPSLYRRMPAKAIECDPEMYLFLLRYPEVVVNIWDLMGITQVQIQRVGPTSLKANDGAGTECVAHLVYGDRDLHLYYAEGYYEGPLLKNRVYGKCVLLLRSTYTPGQEDRMIVTNHLDVFLKVDNLGVDLLAKTLSPLVGKSADYNFTESAAFLGKLSQAAEENGPGIQRLAANLAQVDPAVRDRFAELAGAISQRAVLREVQGFEMEQPASEVVQRAIDQGVTPFGAPLDDPLTPLAPIAPDPPRRGITLRR